jgi:hypothetical protein
MSSHKVPPKAWKPFLDSVDRTLTEAVELHCFGGFVVTQMYGLARTTSDIDFISLVPNHWRTHLVEIAGKGSDLHRTYGLYLDPVTVVTPPEDYETRLTPMYDGVWKRLRVPGSPSEGQPLVRFRSPADLGVRRPLGLRGRVHLPCLREIDVVGAQGREYLAAPARATD